LRLVIERKSAYLFAQNPSMKESGWNEVKA